MQTLQFAAFVSFTCTAFMNCIFSNGNSKCLYSLQRKQTPIQGGTARSWTYLFHINGLGARIGIKDRAKVAFRVSIKAFKSKPLKPLKPLKRLKRLKRLKLLRSLFLALLLRWHTPSCKWSTFQVSCSILSSHNDDTYGHGLCCCYCCCCYYCS